MQKSSIQVECADSWVDPLTSKQFTARKKLGRLADSLLSAVRGNRYPMQCDMDTVAAFQTGVATTSGDTTVTIGGVATVVAFDTSQTITATAVCTALNALTTALSKGGVDIEADNRAGTFTLTSTAVGTTFNIGQYQLRAVAKAADAYGTFEVSGSDTADAQAMVAAIKAWPGLSDLVAANNSSGVVSIFSRRQSTPARDLALYCSAEVASVAVLTAGTTFCVSSVRKGLIGNHITTACTGTGASMAAARMTGGTTTRVTL